MTKSGLLGLTVLIDADTEAYEGQSRKQPSYYGNYRMTFSLLIKTMG